MLANKLNYLSIALTLRQTLGGVNILKSLVEVSDAEWARCKDANTDTHLIAGVTHDSKKTDAIRAYISKLGKLYMNSVGVVPGAWTKNTLEAEHNLTKAVSDRICITDIRSADQLFTMVAGRMLGVDLALIKLVLAEDTAYQEQAAHLINYLLQLTGDGIDVPAEYPQLLAALTTLLEKQLLDDQFYDLLMSHELVLDNPELPQQPVEMLEAAVVAVAARNDKYSNGNGGW